MGKNRSFDEYLKEVIEGLGEDEDVVGALKEAIDWGGVVREAVKSPEVKGALLKLVVRVIENLDPSGDDDLSSSILDGLNVGSIVKRLMNGDEVFQAEVAKAIREKAVEHLRQIAEDGDNETFSDAIGESVDVAEALKKLLKVNDELRESIDDAIQKGAESMVTSIDWNEDGWWDSVKESIQEKLGDLLSEEEVDKILRKLFEQEDGVLAMLTKEIEKLVKEEIDEELGSKEDDEVYEKIREGLPINRCLSVVLSDRAKVEGMLNERLESIVENWVGSLSVEDGVIAEALRNNPQLASHVSDSINSMITGGGITDLICSIVEKIVKGDEQLEGTVLANVANAIAGKIAAGLVRNIV